jgi:hypothetical protein
MRIDPAIFVSRLFVITWPLKTTTDEDVLYDSKFDLDVK